MNLITEMRHMTTVCGVCGHTIVDVIPHEIEGIHVERTLAGGMEASHIHMYLCNECNSVVKEHIQGGVDAARKRVRDYHKDLSTC